MNIPAFKIGFFRLILFVAAISLFGNTLLLAEPTGKRYAVLVGINEYLDPGILKLGTPRNDATDLGISLANAGWDKTFVLTDDKDARNADFPTRGNIERRISLLAELASPTDTVMLFFSGHGLIEDTNELFLPVDADSTRLGSSALRLADQTRAFTDKGITRVILVVDACRESLNKSKGLSVVGIGGGNIQAVNGSDPAYKMYATKSGWFSYEDENGRNGVFTRFLLAGLGGAAAGAAGGPRDAVSIADLAAWLPDAVGSYALDRGLRQKPVVLEMRKDSRALLLSKPAAQASTLTGSGLTAPAIIPAARSIPTAARPIASILFSANLRDDITGIEGKATGGRLVPDRFGHPASAWYHTGSEEYLNFGDSAAYTFDDQLTISLWLKPMEENSRTSCPVSRWKEMNGADTFSWVLMGNGADTAGFRLFDKGNFVQLTNWKKNPDPFVWNHLVAVFDGRKARVYLNNKLIQEQSAAGFVAAPAGIDFLVGRDGYGNGAKETIDDIRLYRTALGTAEIDRLFHEGG